MSDFTPELATRACLVESANILGAFRKHVVLVGGCVPELLFPNRGHKGTLDVDFAVANLAHENAYFAMLQRMLDAGYSHRANPTRFERQIPGLPDPVRIDLITGGGQTIGAPPVSIGGLSISVLRGIEWAFEAWQEVEISGQMPNHQRNTVRLRVVRPEAFILIKAIALGERLKSKDAYDIAFVMRHYQPDLGTLAEQMKPLMVGNPLADEAMQILTDKFDSIDSVGPASAAQESSADGADYGQARRAAFENVQSLIQHLNELRSRHAAPKS